MIRSYFGDVAKPWIVMGGGIERQDSIFGALQACPGDTDYVFITTRYVLSSALLYSKNYMKQ
jgi:2-C-methyl-D-erythritol 4-phosphate cytidylyltransferase